MSDVYVDDDFCGLDVWAFGGQQLKDGHLLFGHFRRQTLEDGEKKS